MTEWLQVFLNKFSENIHFVSLNLSIIGIKDRRQFFVGSYVALYGYVWVWTVVQTTMISPGSNDLCLSLSPQQFLIFDPTHQSSHQS